MNGDTGSRGERRVKGVWRGRGQFRELRKQDVREWGAQQAGRRGSEWRTREQDWRTQEKRDREDSWEMVWLFRVEGIILTHADRWPSSQHCPWTLQAPGVVPLPQTGGRGLDPQGPV